MLFNLFKRNDAGVVPAAANDAVVANANANASAGASTASEIAPSPTGDKGTGSMEAVSTGDGDQASASAATGTTTGTGAPPDGGTDVLTGSVAAAPGAPPATIAEAAAGGANSEPATAPRRTDAASLGFKTTAELAPLSGLIGQDDALHALRIAAASRAARTHILVTAPKGGDAFAALAALLAATPRAGPAPADWVYVHDFDTPHRPRALRLAAGSARRLDAAITDALGEVAATLPAALAADDHAAGRRAIDAETIDAHDERLLALGSAAEAQNIAILRTPSGYAAAPMLDGKVVKPDVFARLPEAMRRDVETRVTAVQAQLAAHLGERAVVEKERRARRATHDATTARACVGAAFAPARSQFADEPGVLAHIAAVEAALIGERASAAIQHFFLRKER